MNLTIRIVLAMLAIAFAAGVHAQAYVAAGLGISKIETESTSGDGVAWSIGVGYRFNQHLAVEASYTDFGSTSDSFDRNAPDAEGGSGLGLAVIGSLPLSSAWTIVGKLGMQDLGSGQFDRAAPPTDVGWTSVIGAGVQWSIDKNFALRAMAEQVNGAGALDSIRLMSLGALYSF